MKFAYFPGCSVESTALEYGQSVEEIFTFLGVDLREIRTWNCCGASSGHVMNPELTLALSGRNLFLAEQMSMDMLTLCPACFIRHKAAQNELKENRHLKTKIEKDIGRNLELSSKIRHVIEVLYYDVGIKLIQEKVRKSLKGLRVVPYYGCYLVRPHEIADYDDRENPIILEKLMESIEVECIDWPCKVDCCGASLGVTNPEIVKRLIAKIANTAHELGAEAIVTACPLCETNLDIYQSNSTRIPILFFSEIIALAFGSLRVKEWIKRHLISPFSVLEKFKL
ncbi:MAG: CoB--CoM heterodisulfide reductase iron-sulfur subunit B family protein [Candidatus Helarchaeota archaeon]|nr:CoB--CoM heterodisulfide reductase iron-sulfur subunit B family protein [Candidatus Helarchaeota archaeon]